MKTIQMEDIQKDVIAKRVTDSRNTVNDLTQELSVQVFVSENYERTETRIIQWISIESQRL